jgi:hypothetical protein
MDMSFLDVSPTLKAVVYLATTPLVVLLTWVKFRNGSLTFSQARMQRLYDIMLRDDACSVPSGALVAAVKDAFGVEMDGDKVRFALRRDNPLMVLRAFKVTLNMVKLSPDGLSCGDARRNPKWTFQAECRFFASVLAISHATLLLAAAIFNGAHAGTIAALFAIELLAAPVLVNLAVRAEAAHRLTTPGSYRLPASTLERLSPSLAIITSGHVDLPDARSLHRRKERRHSEAGGHVQDARLGESPGPGRNPSTQTEDLR